ncbi:MAG: putative cysteine desulfurase [Ignavibacteria bacterium]|nr:putative cysteine desulfurase [Ignavibacteria bacterium]
MNIDIVNENISFDVYKLRKEFPLLDQQINGCPLVYFDNAATNQKPLSVINSIREYYETINSNVHRGIHTLSERATEAYENSREKVREFISASGSNEIIFVRGTTEAVNLAASTYGMQFINEGDEIIVSAMEHHSNLVPWQNLTSRKKALLKFIPITDNGELVMDEFKSMLNEKVKFISVVYVSNTLGTINPVKEIISAAHSYNIPVFIDAAQASPHIKIDVKELDCDFLAFSGHKTYGPTGIGILYAKEKYLDLMPPYQFGGEMIKNVSYEHTEYNNLPFKFEAGTPNISGAVSLASAIDFINEKGLLNIARHESDLLKYAENRMNEIEGMNIIGNAKNKTGVISFIINGIHPYDTGSILDNLGIAVRTGFHCTQPLIEQRYNLPGTVRISFAVYNTVEEIDRFIDGLHKVKKMLS